MQFLSRLGPFIFPTYTLYLRGKNHMDVAGIEPWRAISHLKPTPYPLQHGLSGKNKSSIDLDSNWPVS